MYELGLTSVLPRLLLGLKMERELGQRFFSWPHAQSWWESWLPMACS